MIPWSYQVIFSLQDLMARVIVVLFWWYVRVIILLFACSALVRGSKEHFWQYLSPSITLNVYIMSDTSSISYLFTYWHPMHLVVHMYFFVLEKKLVTLRTDPCQFTTHYFYSRKWAILNFELGIVHHSWYRLKIELVLFKLFLFD